MARDIAGAGSSCLTWPSARIVSAEVVQATPSDLEVRLARTVLAPASRCDHPRLREAHPPVADLDVLQRSAGDARTAISFCPN